MCISWWIYVCIEVLDLIEKFYKMCFVYFDYNKSKIMNL